MVGFRRFFFVIFISFALIFLFIFLIRLANNKTGFLGLNDLFSFFETEDLYKPITNFKNTFDRLSKAVNNFAKTINIDNVFNSSSSGSGGRGYDDPEWYEKLGSYIGSLFGYIGNNVKSFFNLLYTILAMPILLIFNLVQLIIDYFGIFIRFVDYIINFEGFTSSTLITT